MHIINSATGKAQDYCLAKAPVVQSQQKFIEITLAVVVGVSERNE